MSGNLLEKLSHKVTRKVNTALSTSQYLRNLWLGHFYGELDPTCYISPKAIIFGAKGIKIGPAVKIFPHATLNCTAWQDFSTVNGSIEIGRGTVLQPFSFLHADQGSIKIGEHCSVNPYCVLYGQGGLTIGNYVRIAAHTIIVPSNHNFDNVDIPIKLQGSTGLGIKIEDDVWIGAGVRILDGVTIGTGCVIGAGSVITKSTDSYGVYVGTPARKIKERNNYSTNHPNHVLENSIHDKE
jgi:acetyltransferase-like isoleucine patch superfamily enzyme